MNNTSSPQSTNPNAVTYRTPPPPPGSPTPNTAATITPQSAPQPPLRTNVLRHSVNMHHASASVTPPRHTLSSNSNRDEEASSNSNSSHSSPKIGGKEATPQPPSRLINVNNYETATNAAAKLVYKSAMTGSVQSLNQNVAAEQNTVSTNSEQNTQQQIAAISQQIKSVIGPLFR